MEKCDGNYRGRIRSVGSGGDPMEGVKFSTQAAVGGRRVALRDIKNVTGAPGSHRCPGGKGELLRKDEADDKNSKRFIGHRPITRRFAASLANQAQNTDQGSVARHGTIGCERQQKPLPSGTNPNDHTCTVIDVDDFQPANDLPLPMIEEIDDMVNCELKEVEMEDIEEDRLPDIDSFDMNNPLAVVEYVEDIYNFYRQTEDVGCVSPDYMSNQFDINEKMRAILIDWLIEVHYKFELMDQTLFLTVNIIDRFLSRQTVVRKKLQLVGITAMLLACKYEEVSVPVVEDLILISDRVYTRAEVLDMEKLMVNTLQFNMSIPTPYVFIQRFLKAAESDKKLELLSFFLIELCLVEYQMLKFRPSLLAAAAVYTAQCTLKGFKFWSKLSELHSRYPESQLLECSMMIVEFHQKAGEGKLTAVLKKYNTSRFGYAARSEPASFLLNG